MNIRQAGRLVLLIAATLLLIGLAWLMVSGGIRQLPRAHAAGQQVETAVQFACALLCLLTVGTCFWRRRWGTAVRTAWAVSLAAATSLSALVWGPPSPMVAVAFLAAALLLAEAITWALRTALPA